MGRHEGAFGGPETGQEPSSSNKQRWDGRRPFIKLIAFAAAALVLYLASGFSGRDTAPPKELGQGAIGIFLPNEEPITSFQMSFAIVQGPSGFANSGQIGFSAPLQVSVNSGRYQSPVYWLVPRSLGEALGNCEGLGVATQTDDILRYASTIRPWALFGIGNSEAVVLQQSSADSGRCDLGHGDESVTAYRSPYYYLGSPQFIAGFRNGSVANRLVSVNAGESTPANTMAPCVNVLVPESVPDLRLSSSSAGFTQLPPSSPSEPFVGYERRQNCGVSPVTNIPGDSDYLGMSPQKVTYISDTERDQQSDEAFRRGVILGIAGGLAALALDAAIESSPAAIRLLGRVCQP